MLNNEPTGTVGVANGTGHDLVAVLPATAASFTRNHPDAEMRRAEMVARLRLICSGRSAAGVAALTRTHTETTRRYLNGLSTPHPAFLGALCDALGVSEAWLLCGRGDPYREGGPHRVHVTPREAAVAVRTTLRELLTKMAELEGMLEYPRLNGEVAPAPENPDEQDDEAATTPREAVVAVRSSLHGMLGKMGALERMLEYPRLNVDAAGPTPPRNSRQRSYEAATTRADPSLASTRTGALRLRQRA